jgi:hypothetical protein
MFAEKFDAPKKSLEALEKSVIVFSGSVVPISSEGRTTDFL